jgi:hypothetical protein
MATSRKELEELHVLVAQSYKNRIEQDIADNIPTDAATLSGAVKFLKDNAITADPADQDDLADLRNSLREQAEKRRKKQGAHLALAKSDMDALEA